MTDRCQIPRCRGGVDLIYLDRGVCADHWNELNAGDAPASALRMALGIEADAEPATEDTMARKKTETTTTEAAAHAAEAAPETAARAARKPRSKSRKAAAAKKVDKPAEAAQAKPDKPPKEDLVVFAIRLTQAERDAIHQASGPRNATQFVRRVAAAFANEDEAAFRTLVKEAQQARS